MRPVSGSGHAGSSGKETLAMTKVLVVVVATISLLASPAVARGRSVGHPAFVHPGFAQFGMFRRPGFVPHPFFANRFFFGNRIFFGGFVRGPGVVIAPYPYAYPYPYYPYPPYPYYVPQPPPY